MAKIAIFLSQLLLNLPLADSVAIVASGDRQRQHVNQSVSLPSAVAFGAVATPPPAWTEDAMAPGDPTTSDDSTASAEAMADAAEAELAQGVIAPVMPVSPVKSVLASTAVAQKVRRFSANETTQTAGSKDAEATDDSHYDSEEDPDRDSNGEITTVRPLVGDELESFTPAGKVAKARALLQDNLLTQAEIAAAITDLGNETAFQSRVDTEATQVGKETETVALAAVLGTMRKEMRKFASPFYMERLLSEQQTLKAAEIELEANLVKAEAAIQSRMAESRLHPAGLRGSSGGATLSAENITTQAEFRTPPPLTHSAAETMSSPFGLVVTMALAIGRLA